jgi:hypothetical protein
MDPPIDMLLTVLSGPNKAQVDIIKLDEKFAQHDSDYDPENCTYKGQEGIAMQEYVRTKFGEEALNFLNSILD